MARLTRTSVIDAALDLLSSEGLDAVTTRRLAQRLGVESPALYWHFKDKPSLLHEMAMTVMNRHHTSPPPDHDDWLGWFADNARSFRRALLVSRDGARLHAGTIPDLEGRTRVAPKVAYLVRHGLTEAQAGMALYAASQYTLGCVLEEQARHPHDEFHTAKFETGPGSEEVLALGTHLQGNVAQWSEAAFEFGLQLLVDGLRQLNQGNSGR